MTTLYHGTTVGWLDQIRLGTNEIYGFEAGHFKYGETSSSLPFIWLTEDRDHAVFMASHAKTSVAPRLAKLGPGTDRFPGDPMPLAEWIYEVEIEPDSLILDLSAKKLRGDLNRRVKGAVKTMTTEMFGTPSRRDSILMDTPVGRRWRYSRANQWLNWLEREILLRPAPGTGSVGDDEHYIRLHKVCDIAGIAYVIHPKASFIETGRVRADAWEGRREWAMMMFQDNLTGTPTYKIKSKHQI